MPKKIHVSRSPKHTSPRAPIPRRSRWLARPSFDEAPPARESSPRYLLPAFDRVGVAAATRPAQAALARSAAAQGQMGALVQRQELDPTAELIGGGAAEPETELDPPIEEVDEKDQMVSDHNALIRTAPPNVQSTGNTVPYDAQIKITKRWNSEQEGEHVYVEDQYGSDEEPRDVYGWTKASNLSTTDMPTASAYGCTALSGYFVKNGDLLQSDTHSALGNIDDPITVGTGDAQEEYYLRITEAMYPSYFGHASRGHYTGHCLDVAFADSSGAKKDYSGAAKDEIEEQGDAAFANTYHHADHFHGCVSYPSWVSNRPTSRLKTRVRERKNEF